MTPSEEKRVKRGVGEGVGAFCLHYGLWGSKMGFSLLVEKGGLHETLGEVGLFCCHQDPREKSANKRVSSREIKS